MHSRDPTEAQSGINSDGLPPGVDIDIEVCGHCGGSVKVIAYIEDQNVIDRILTHLREREQGRPTLSHLLPLSRAPPWTISSFRTTRIPNLKSARTLLKNVWHGGLHTTVQQWTDMNCAITGQSDFFAAAPLVQSGNAVVAPQPTPGRAFVCLVAASAPLGTGRARAMVSGAFFSPLERRNLDRWRFGILLHICDGRHLK